MTDTAYKTVTLLGKTDQAPNRPAVGTLRGGQPMSWKPTNAVMLAQDTVLESARTVVLEVHVDGAQTWAVDSGTDPDAAGQHYPDTTTWRTILDSVSVTVTPGCYLEAHVVFAPSGMAEEQDGSSNWIGAGAQGSIRIGVTWSNGISSDGPNYHSVALPGSKGTYGALPTANGSDWVFLDERLITEIWPSGIDTSEATSAAYSEFSNAVITVEVLGGARPHSVIVYEKPFAHTQDHNESTDQSAHAYRISGKTPNLIDITAAPLQEAADGATYEENRFGSHQMLKAPNVQISRLGPTIAGWSAWGSDPTYQTQTAHNPVTTMSTTFVDVFDSSITSWGADNPGIIISCPYAQIYDFNDDEHILDGRACAIPVRISISASWTDQAGGAGTVVRFQSSAVSWIDIPVTAGSQTVTNAYGFLQGQVYGDQSIANCQVFIKTSSGDGNLYSYCIGVDKT